MEKVKNENANLLKMFLRDAFENQERIHNKLSSVIKSKT